MNKNYYIVFMIICSIIMSCLYGLNHNECFPNTSIASEEFSKHFLIHRLFSFIGIVIISFFLLKFEEKALGTESKDENNNKNENNKKNLLIYNDNENGIKSNKLIVFYCLIILCWVLIDDIIQKYIIIFQDLDFWMFELIFLWILSIKFFKYELYKHHYLAILLCIFASLLKIGCILVTFFGFTEDDEEKNSYNGGLKIYYKDNPIEIFIGIILYFILIFLRSYISLKLKWFMDKKNTSHIKLFRFYGIFGIIIYFNSSLIGTFVGHKKNDDDDDVTAFDYLFKVKSTDNNKIILYLESFIIYFSNYNSFLSIFREILTILLGTFFFSFKIYFSILIIKYLTPVHVIISIPIVFLLEKIIMFLHFLFDTKKGFCKGNNNKIIKFFLDISGDCFSVLGFLIYLEIIILKFCKYDYNTKDNIMKRSFGEINEINEDDETEVILNDSDIKGLN